MKTYLFLILLSVASLTAEAQGAKYKSLEECKNDTLSYINYNFYENKNRYIGKTMQFFMDEANMKLITKSFYIGGTGPFTPIEIRSKINGIFFEYLYDAESEHRDILHIPYYTICINFKVPPYTHAEEEFNALCNKVENPKTEYVSWGTPFYNFFKDYIIEDIYIYRNFQQ